MNSILHFFEVMPAPIRMGSCVIVGFFFGKLGDMYIEHRHKKRNKRH